MRQVGEMAVKTSGIHGAVRIVVQTGQKQSEAGWQDGSEQQWLATAETRIQCTEISEALWFPFVCRDCICDVTLVLSLLR